MRIALACFALVACTDTYGPLSIDPADGPPIGVGLVERYEITQQLCEAGPDGDCGNEVSPMALSATLAHGDAVALTAVTPFDGSRASVTLTGVAEGGAQVAITGEQGVTTSFSFSATPVAKTELFVARSTGDTIFDTTFAPVHGPIHAFAGDVFAVSQINTDGNSRQLAGRASLAIDAHATGLQPATTCACSYTTAGCDCFATAAAGTAYVQTPAASLEVDVVGADAIAGFTIDDTVTTELDFVATLATNALYLIPHDAAGNPIVGRGPEPVVTIADPTIAYLYADLPGEMRSLNLVTDKAGDTTMDVAWGAVHQTFKIHVVPLN